jgi:hypothetical protein
MKATDGEDFISIHEVSMAIDKKDSVRIPIKGDANISASVEHMATQ